MTPYIAIGLRTISSPRYRTRGGWRMASEDSRISRPLACEFIASVDRSDSPQPALRRGAPSPASAAGLEAKRSKSKSLGGSQSDVLRRTAPRRLRDRAGASRRSAGAVHDGCRSGCSRRSLPHPNNSMSSSSAGRDDAACGDRELMLDLPAESAHAIANDGDREAALAVDEADDPLLDVLAFPADCPHRTDFHCPRAPP